MNKFRYKFSRYGMYTRIEEHIKKMKLEAGKCLIIGDTLEGRGANPSLFDMLPKGTTVVAPDFPEVDIHELPYENNSFDYVLADQVLEHVRKPWVGVEEIRKVLKPGGLVVLTSVFMYYKHAVPEDYWRFSPEGLEVLCEQFFKIHTSGGIGNEAFVSRVCLGGPGGRVNPGSELEKEALVCNNKHLVLVWVIAEK